MALTLERQLLLISKAWGRQQGYCFFPVIAGDAADKEERIRSYNEGPAFQWPQDRERILDWWNQHIEDDVYWCPSLFEEPRRRLEFAMDEHCLWADLDEVDPKAIEDYPPSVAWETSPGRYQALWLVATGQDMQGASWRGRENHQLTVHLKADQSGWDTTQLLRIPGWPNHKPEYRKGGKPVQGTLLWDRSRDKRYMPDEFADLPEIEGLTDFDTILEDQIVAVDRRAVWARVRLKCSREVRELVASRTVQGDRSHKLWQIERDLADAGCTASEIVAIVRATVWNKYVGRQDELKRLTSEAAKAIAARPEKIEKQLEVDREGFPDPTPFKQFLENVRPTKWLIKDIWTEGGCGFIAGHPKSWKSWIALDMAMSVANGMDFLGSFRVSQPGPVLYIQEEDAPPILKDRYEKVWPGKKADKVIIENGQPVWVPATEDDEPNIAVMVKQGFTLSDPEWQGWLDEQLAKGFNGVPYRMVIFETLMRVSGDVDEVRSSDMTQRVFQPLDLLADKHNAACVIVHHMRKQTGNGKDTASGGQKMLGSTANDAFYRDALFISHTKSGLEVHRSSKAAGDMFFDLTGIRNSKVWDPRVSKIRGHVDGDTNPNPSMEDVANAEDPGIATRGRSAGKVSRVLIALRTFTKPVTKAEVAARINVMNPNTKPVSPQGCYIQLRRLEERNLVHRPMGEGLWAVTDYGSGRKAATT